jgi:hypothetical protein
MKYFILFLFSSAFFSFSQKEQNQIEEIKSWYKEIESNLKNCAIVKNPSFWDDNYPTGSTLDLVGYYDSTKGYFVKIITYSGGDWHEEWNSYYFNDSILFFIYSRGYTPGEYYTAEEMEMSEEEYWQSGGECKNLDAFEQRLYYADKKCIRFLSKNEIVKDYDENIALTDTKNVTEDPSAENYTRIANHAAAMAKSLTKIE